MGSSSPVEMSDEELAEFLESGGTGVISFSTDIGDPPYALPVSYGYDERHEQFYFRLALPADSGKEDVLDHPVTFVTYRQTDDGWRSAIVTGELEEVADFEFDSSAIQGMWTVEIPLVDIFERPTREVTFRHFRLVPGRLSGRKEATSST